MCPPRKRAWSLLPFQRRFVVCGLRPTPQASPKQFLSNRERRLVMKAARPMMSTLCMFVMLLTGACWTSGTGPVAEVPTIGVERPSAAVHSSEDLQDRPAAELASTITTRLGFQDWRATYSGEIMDGARACLHPDDDLARVVLLFLPEDDGELLLWEVRRNKLGGEHVPELATCIDAQLSQLPHHPYSDDEAASVIMFAFDP